ncbi:hypothetical protein ABW21_db0205441 [Orbilia brochopaga]|nr:hypothetical protein ABW21_db0205441 [Drechslerella brochopaga]
MKWCYFFGLGLAAVADGFILSFQQADDPDILITPYPYINRYSGAIDPTECQRGPESESEVLAVGVLNAVPQRIRANTDRIMYGIALWQNTDCEGTPALLIGWRPDQQGIQIANLFRIGLATPVGSWVDLDMDNIYLTERPEGGFVYNPRTEVYFTYEDGQWVVQDGEATSYIGALNELAERATKIWGQYIAAAADSNLGGVEPIDTPTELWVDSASDPIVEEDIWTETPNLNTPSEAGWQPDSWSEEMTASPNPVTTNNIGQQGRSVLPNQQTENSNNVDNELAQLAYNLGGRNPMMSMNDFAKGYPLMEMIMNSQRNPPQQSTAADIWQTIFNQASQNIPSITNAFNIEGSSPRMAVEQTEPQPQNQERPGYLGMLSNIFAPQQRAGNGIMALEPLPSDPEDSFRLDRFRQPPNSYLNSETNSQSALIYQNLQRNRQPQADRFEEEYSPMTGFDSASDLRSPYGRR